MIKYNSGNYCHIHIHYHIHIDSFVMIVYGMYITYGQTKIIFVRYCSEFWITHWKK